MEDDPRLEPLLLERFVDRFVGYLGNYKLSYYFRNPKNELAAYPENTIHSSVIWIREAVKYINTSGLNAKEMGLADLIALIAFVDIIVEGTDQIYRVLYQEKHAYPESGVEVFCDINDAISAVKTDREYFKQIRALFGAHPTNLYGLKDKTRFADIPLCSKSRFGALIGVDKYDFHIRTWVNESNDDNQETVGLHLDDLIMYAKQRYDLLNEFHSRLADIAYRRCL